MSQMWLRTPFPPYFAIYNMATMLPWRKSDVGCTPATSKKTLRTAHITSHITGASGVTKKHGYFFGRMHQKHPLLTQLQINEQAHAYKKMFAYL